MLDIPGTTMWPDGHQAMKMTAAGKKFLPSLKDYSTDRPLHVGELKGSDWEPEEVFADEGGTGKALFADPIVIINKKTQGRLYIAIQNAQPFDPQRAPSVIEFIQNWLGKEKQAFSVEPLNKLTTTWGQIKINKTYRAK
jgi:hypothetical protein